MEEISLFVLNSNFMVFYIISEFNSLIWTDRYSLCGDFQLEVLYTKELMENVKVGNYISLGGSSDLMIIDSIDICYDPAEKTNQTITYKGRTLESLLERRIIWGQWGSERRTNVQTIIMGLINDAIVSPSDSKRSISFFRTQNGSGISGSDYSIAALGDGDNLYKVVSELCKTLSVGMKCIFSEPAGTITFTLYVGRDRSYDQTSLPPVIFSSAYENLGPSRFSFNTTNFRTVALAVGPWVTAEKENEEDDEPPETRTILEVGDLSSRGLNRREIFVTGSKDDPTTIADAAMKELASLNQLEAMDSELDAKRQFVYGTDFNIGDIVQVITDFGLDKKARVTEFIRSWDAGGYTEVPTFEIMED